MASKAPKGGRSVPFTVAQRIVLGFRLGFGSQARRSSSCVSGFHSSTTSGPSCGHRPEVGSHGASRCVSMLWSSRCSPSAAGFSSGGQECVADLHLSSEKLTHTQSSLESEPWMSATVIYRLPALYSRASSGSGFSRSVLLWQPKPIYPPSLELLGSHPRTHRCSERVRLFSARSLATPRGASTATADYESDEDYSSCSASDDEEDEHPYCEGDDHVHGTAGRASNEDHDMARPRLLAPIRDLIAEAVARGYAKYNSQGLARATSNPKFVAAPDSSIVNHFSAVIRGIVNYYSFVNKRSSLWKVTSIYRKSCALTLARKHSLRSAQAAYHKFGPNLRISDPDREPVILFYPDSLKTTGKFSRSPRYSEVTILQEPHDKRNRSRTGPRPGTTRET